MKCFSHPETDATATCQGCGKGLCLTCTGRFEIVSCQDCLLAHNKLVSRQMYMGLALTAGIFFSCVFFLIYVQTNTGRSLSAFGTIFPSLMLAFTYWGWRFISPYFPTPLTVATWLFLLLPKFIIAYFIGIIVGPYRIFRHFQNLYIARKAKRDITQNPI